MMSCMLKLNAAVWQQKLNTEDLGGQVLRMEQKGIHKKGLRWNPPGKRKQGRPKTGRLKRDVPGGKGVAALS